MIKPMPATDTGVSNHQAHGLRTKEVKAYTRIYLKPRTNRTANLKDDYDRPVFAFPKTSDD
jgi:hypothetical protein